MTELASRDYPVRTEQNVVDSDGTLIISRGPLTGGSALTLRLARRHRRPVLHVDLDAGSGSDSVSDAGPPRAIAGVRDWLLEHHIRRLNVAGCDAREHLPGHRQGRRAIHAHGSGRLSPRRHPAQLQSQLSVRG